MIIIHIIMRLKNRMIRISLLVLFVFFVSCNNGNTDLGTVSKIDDLSKKSILIYDDLATNNFKSLKDKFSEDVKIKLGNSISYNFDEFVLFFSQNELFFKTIKLDTIDVMTLNLNNSSYISSHEITFIFNDSEYGTAYYINTLLELTWTNNKINIVNIYFDSTLFLDYINFN